MSEANVNTCTACNRAFRSQNIMDQHYRTCRNRELLPDVPGPAIDDTVSERQLLAQLKFDLKQDVKRCTKIGKREDLGPALQLGSDARLVAKAVEWPRFPLEEVCMPGPVNERWTSEEDEWSSEEGEPGSEDEADEEVEEEMGGEEEEAGRSEDEADEEVEEEMGGEEEEAGRSIEDFSERLRTMLTAFVEKHGATTCRETVLQVVNELEPAAEPSARPVRQRKRYGGRRLAVQPFLTISGGGTRGFVCPFCNKTMSGGRTHLNRHIQKKHR